MYEFTQYFMIRFMKQLLYVLHDNVNIATGSNNTVKYLVNKFKIHRFIAI